MKNILKINLGIFCFILLLELLFIPSHHANAYFSAAEDSTFGEWDNPTGIATKTMKLVFLDTQNGIEEFELTVPDKEEQSSPTKTWDATVPVPISHPYLYKPEGKEALFSLKYYDNNKNETYDISIPNLNKNISYGNGYFIDSTISIKFLNSKLELPEDDDGAEGIFSAVDANDIIKLNLIYTSAGKNIIKADPTTQVNQSDQDIQFVKETVDAESKLDFSFLIPLVSKNNPSEKKQITATLKLVDKNLIFTTGLQTSSTNTLNENQTEGESTSSTDSTESNLSSTLSTNNGIPQDTGFQGHGVKIPRKDTYKGLSTITNFEDFIAGITNFILTFVAVISVIMLVYGGYLWITDQGDEGNAEKAKKIIASSVIGILIIISAYTIVNTVIGLEGNTEPGCNINIQNISELDCNFQNLDEIDMPLVGQGVGAVAGKSVGAVFGGDTGGIIGGLLGISGGNLVGDGVNNILGGNNFFKDLFK